MSLLEFRNVRLDYAAKGQSIQALENIDVTVSQGEFLTIVGPSGCGKSSLLSLAAGTLLPSYGEVLFHGRRIAGTDPGRGIMLQNSTLFSWLSVLENVAFGLKMKGYSKKERTRQAEDYLEHVGLADFAKQRPYELSGGMKQRVALARTLINDPELVLMDEPFGALDAITKRKMRSLLQNMWQETRKTFVFVTHEVEEAITLGTRIIVMSQRPGQIIRDILIDPASKTKEYEESKEFKQLRREIHSLLE